MTLHGARVRYFPGTNVNTPFFQVAELEIAHGAGGRVEGRKHVLGHKRDCGSLCVHTVFVTSG